MRSTELSRFRRRIVSALLPALVCLLLPVSPATAVIQQIDAEGTSTSAGTVQIVGLDPGDPTQQLFNISVDVPVDKRPKPAARRVTQVLNNRPAFNTNFLAARPGADLSIVLILQKNALQYRLLEEPPGQLPENPVILDQDYLVQDAVLGASTPDCIRFGVTIPLTITAQDPLVDFTLATGVYLGGLVQTSNFLVVSATVVSVDALLLAPLPPDVPQVIVGTVELPPDDIGNPVYAAAFEVCVDAAVSTEPVTWGRLKALFR